MLTVLFSPATTYQEQEGNLRATGHLHHIESKRVKVIVKVSAMAKALWGYNKEYI